MALAFGTLEIDLERREVLRDGRALVVQPLVFDLLRYFAEHPNVLVSKADLIREVWGGAEVGDGAIAQAMSLVRRVVDGNAAAARIHTVWGRGYRLVANVREIGTDGTGAPVDPRPMPHPSHAPFVGRAPVMALLDRALDDARHGHVRVVLLSGEPGIGKTRTCAEFAKVAVSKRARVFATNVPETGGAPTFWTWTEVVRQAIESAPAALRDDPGTAALRQALLTEAPADDGASEHAPHDGERARLELFDLVATFWASLAADHPLVVIFDDVHRADVESLELLDFVVERAARARVLFVVTLRPPELYAEAVRTRAIGVLAGRSSVVSTRLERLSWTDVAELVERLTGEARDDALVTSLLNRSGGNPFLLKELVWLWLRRPETERGTTAERALPTALLPAIERHLDVLSVSCRELLTVASVIGREFDLSILAAAHTPVADRASGIDEAVRAEVVASLPEGRFRFVHALLRDAVYDALPAERRIALHARVGRAIETTYGTGNAQLAALAHHFYEAATAGHARRALAYSTRAARVAARASAFREAVAHYRRAIEVAPLADASEEKLLVLQVALTEAAANAGDFETLLGQARAAMAAARRQGDALAFARAADCFSLRAEEMDVPRPEAIRVIEEALKRHTAEDALRVRLLTRLARAQWFAAPPAVSRSLAERALEAGRRVGDPGALALALTRAYIIFLGPAEYFSVRRAIAQEMLALLPRLREPAVRLDGLWHSIPDAIERGDRIAYDDRCAAMFHEAAESPHPFAGWYAASFRTARLHLEGRFAEAEAEARRALTLAGPGGATFSGFVFTLQLTGIRMTEGRFDEYVDELRGSVTADRPAIVQANLALGDALCGRRREADEAFSALVADDLATIPRDINWPPALVFLAELCVALERVDAATTLASHLRPFERYHVLFGASMLHYGAIGRRIGQLEALLGHTADAEGFLRDGIDRDARMGAPAFVALGRLALAELLGRRGGRAAHAEATGLLEAVVADAGRLGLRRLRAEAENALGR